jgi:hypothetical protein
MLGGGGDDSSVAEKCETKNKIQTLKKKTTIWPFESRERIITFTNLENICLEYPEIHYTVLYFTVGLMLAHSLSAV